MTSNGDAYTIYLRLLAQYDAALDAATSARQKVSRAFYDCAEGRGTGPDPQDIARAIHLETAASEYWRTMVLQLDATFPGP